MNLPGRISEEKNTIAYLINDDSFHMMMNSMNGHHSPAPHSLPQFERFVHFNIPPQNLLAEHDHSEIDTCPILPHSADSLAEIIPLKAREEELLNVIK